MVVAYEEIVDFIASGTTPDSVIKFRPSESTRLRVLDLVQRQKASGLNEEETAELHRYLELEHIMRMAKARAHQLLGE